MGHNIPDFFCVGEKAHGSLCYYSPEFQHMSIDITAGMLELWTATRQKYAGRLCIDAFAAMEQKNRNVKQNERTQLVISTML